MVILSMGIGAVQCDFHCAPQAKVLACNYSHGHTSEVKYVRARFCSLCRTGVDIAGICSGEHFWKRLDARYIIRAGLPVLVRHPTHGAERRHGVSVG